MTYEKTLYVYRYPKAHCHTIYSRPISRKVWYNYDQKKKTVTQALGIFVFRHVMRPEKGIILPRFNSTPLPRPFHALSLVELYNLRGLVILTCFVICKALEGGVEWVQGEGLLNGLSEIPRYECMYAFLHFHIYNFIPATPHISLSCNHWFYLTLRLKYPLPRRTPEMIGFGSKQRGGACIRMSRNEYVYEYRFNI